MSARAELTLFARIAALPEPDLDLAQAALLIALPEYPSLDPAHYINEIEHLSERARAAIVSDAPVPEGPIAPILRLLYREIGFHGNAADYYDPRNSYLNEVIDRRTGIPISLAVLLLEVCRRCALAAHGVSFPGHFLVRTAGPRGPLLVDPFEGRVLDEAALRALHEKSTGRPGTPDEKLLQPCTKRDLLARMLGNLRQIYSSIGDRPRLASVLERIEVLAGAAPRPVARLLN